MDTEPIQEFLTKVRKSRFIDYLDPIGETALVAFERRLRWAHRSKADINVGEEAQFLLTHEKQLRRLIQEEIREDEEHDWGIASDGPVRGDWSAGPGETAVLVPTAPFADTGDEEAPPVPAAFRKTPMPANQRQHAPAPVVAKRKARSTPAPVIARKTREEEEEPSDLQRTGIIRFEDLTPMSTQRVSPLDPPDIASATVPMAMPRLMTPLGTATPEPAPAVVIGDTPAPVSRSEEDLNTEPSAPPRTQAPPAAAEPNKKPLVWAVAVAVGLLVVGAVVWRFTQSTTPAPEVPVLTEAPPTAPPEIAPPTPPAPSPEAAAIVDPPPSDVPAPAEAEVPPPPTVPAEKTPPPAVVSPPVDTAEPVAVVEVEDPPTPAVVTPPVAPPVAPSPPTARGLWVGKVGSEPIYLTITPQTGNKVTARAELKQGDAFLQLDLRGTFDPETGALTLLDPYNQGRYNATLKDGKLSGTAHPHGNDPTSWSATRK